MIITRNDKYWDARDIIIKLAVLDSSVLDLEKKLVKEYRKVSKRLIRQFRSLYLEIYNDKKGEVLVSHLYQYNRYYEMLNLMNEELLKLGLKEEVLFSTSMVNLYKKNLKVLDLAFGLNSDINPELAKSVLNEVWVADGKLWSDRIWTNKAKFKDALEKGLFDTISTGGGVDTLTATLMDKCSASFSNALRLARTELMHVYNKSSTDLYKQDGIELVLIYTASDSVSNWNIGLNSNGTDPNKRQYQKMNSKFRKTKGEVCLICLDNAERDVGYGHGIYDINDAPPLPSHCNCRCCYLPVVNIDKD